MMIIYIVICGAIGACIANFISYFVMSYFFSATYKPFCLTEVALMCIGTIIGGFVGRKLYFDDKE